MRRGRRGVGVKCSQLAKTFILLYNRSRKIDEERKR